MRKEKSYISKIIHLIYITILYLIGYLLFSSQLQRLSYLIYT